MYKLTNVYSHILPPGKVYQVRFQVYDYWAEKRGSALRAHRLAVYNIPFDTEQNRPNALAAARQMVQLLSQARAANIEKYREYAEDFTPPPDWIVWPGGAEDRYEWLETTFGVSGFVTDIDGIYLVSTEQIETVDAPQSQSQSQNQSQTETV